MSDGIPHDGVTEVPPPSTHMPSNDDLARMLLAGGNAGMPSPGSSPDRGSLRTKLFVALLVGGIGVGASVMSCVGQSFSLRQARALEGIEQQLQKIQAICPTPSPAREVTR